MSGMREPDEFVDSNILVYAFDRTAGAKREKAAELLMRLSSDRVGCTSIQVLQEFYVVVTKKKGMSSLDAAAEISRFAKWKVHRPEPNDVLLAIRLHREKSLSFWDAMILRSAMSCDCSILWSEDFSHGQVWSGLTVRNPFTI